MDDNEKIRNFVNMQYVKMKRMAAIGSLLLLAVNLSFTIYPYVSHRFNNYVFGIPSAWFGVTSIFFLVVFIIWLGSHVYTTTMEMYRSEKKAEIILNPYQVYAFQPFWEMWWRDIYIPQMKAQLVTLKYLKSIEEKKNKENYDTIQYHNITNEINYLESEIKKVENWLDLGYIPKEDFPKHLKKYYITKKQRRL